MKISKQQPPLNADIKAGQTQKAEDAKSGSESNQSQRIAKQTSVKTTLLADKVKQQIQETPDVRADRVAELKAQLKSGDYQINAQKLAGNMLLDVLKDSQS